MPHRIWTLQGLQSSVQAWTWDLEHYNPNQSPFRMSRLLTQFVARYNTLSPPPAKQQSLFTSPTPHARRRTVHACYMLYICTDTCMEQSGLRPEICTKTSHRCFGERLVFTSLHLCFKHHRECNLWSYSQYRDLHTDQLLDDA